MPLTSGDAAPPARTVSRFTIALSLVLLALLILSFSLSWNTRDAMAQLSFLRAQLETKKPAAGLSTLVDIRPWQTAQELAPMAMTAEELGYAHEAERLAGHEVDEAFASALRQAQAVAQHRALTGAALALAQKAAQLQRIVRVDQAHVQALSSAGGNSSSDDLDIAKAQLDLDSDELADEQQDLARTLGDERIRIEQELSAHQAAMKKYDTQAAVQSQSAVVRSKSYGSLAKRLSVWFEQRTRYQFLEEAARHADADAQALTTTHNQAEHSSPAAAATSADTVTRLKAMKSRSMHSQMLSIFDDRIATQQQLAGVYRKWAAQVLLQHRIVFHLLMESLFWVLLILLCAVLLHALIRYLLDRHAAERRSLHTYHLVARLSIQIVSVVLILVVIFGIPSEMPTIVGLTGAGLTVVLQDFIVSFFGWFVLMGKNGIRVGDWVEINGVGGEVVDVGVFRTTLMETGNWADHGHPTGRRVTFINSFAVKGQYFNFSTTGQWMWDEVSVNIFASDKTYATVELIQKAVMEETKEESRLAEEEWKRVGRSNSLNQFSAAPAVNLRPGAVGIDILVRYVTRASNRYEVRNRLYQRVVEVLHKPFTTNPAGLAL